MEGRWGEMEGWWRKKEGDDGMRGKVEKEREGLWRRERAGGEMGTVERGNEMEGRREGWWRVRGMMKKDKW